MPSDYNLNFFFRYYNNRSLSPSKIVSYWTKMRNKYKRYNNNHQDELSGLFDVKEETGKQRFQK